MQLDGRVALVTGASRGIGRALAFALAGRGASVVVAARTLEPGSGRLAGSLRETADAIRAVGQEAFPVACNLDDVAQVGDLAATALGWMGRIDVLVNNAAFLGKATFHSLDELSLVNWQRQLNVNVTAPLLLAKALVPAMRDAGRGVIVNVTSAAGDLFEGNVPGIPYGTTKAALNRLTLALSRDLRADGIAVLAVDPGHVRTEVALQAAQHPGWEINIDDAHLPEVAAGAIADLVEREAAEVSGRVWAVVAGRPVLRHDGRGAGPSEGERSAWLARGADRGGSASSGGP
jgi:NAD(P)-dependent dehydrogenase (short-subunit alcohol dehydrogenase family)